MKLYLDVPASVVATGRQNAEGMIKTTEDLDRYRRVLEATRPTVVVECGTFAGGSARWFAAQGLRVITVDVNPIESTDLITSIGGSSTDPSTVAQVSDLVGAARCMVVLDSDHTQAHVAAEIAAYRGLVSKGCHLVVEDGITRWMPGWEHTPGPLAAIEATDWSGFKRDTATERLHPVTMHPAGWWQRV